MIISLIEYVEVTQEDDIDNQAQFLI